MTAKRELAYGVYLYDEDGKLCCFGPGGDVPAWAAKQITNPSAWGEDPESEDPHATVFTPEPEDEKAKASHHRKAAEK